MTSPQPPAPTGLRVGFVPGVTLTKWRRVWGERFRQPLQVVEVEQHHQRRALLIDDVDMCFVRLPVDREGLHVIPLYDEQPVLWLSKDHLLAALDEVSADDLADVRVIYDAQPDSIELAAYSAAVLRVPMSIARTGSRRDMLYLPVVDAEPTTIGLAWLADNPNPLIEDFIGVVRGRTVNSTRTTQARGGAESPQRPRRTPAPGGSAAKTRGAKRPRRR